MLPMVCRIIVELNRLSAVEKSEAQRELRLIAFVGRNED